MISRKQRKGAKVARKYLHGDSGRSVVMKGAVSKTAHKSAHKMNGNRPILFPLTPTQTDRRILSAAVDTVVAERKK